MTRSLSHRLPVAGDPDDLVRRLSGDPEAWLPTPACRRGTASWLVDLAAGPVHRRVVCGVGAVWQLGDGFWRTVTWNPGAQRDEPIAVQHAMPTFHGELGLTIADQAATLVLSGSYRPPAGAFGTLVDAAVLRKAAESTTAWFIREVAGRLSAERQYSVAH